MAVQLMRADALAAHARDELGITDSGRARPLQAGIFSAVSFIVGGLPAVLAFAVAPAPARIPVLVAVALIALAVLGSIGAIAGRASWRRGALRVLIGGTAAMAITAAWDSWWALPGCEVGRGKRIIGSGARRPSETTLAPLTVQVDGRW